MTDYMKEAERLAQAYVDAVLLGEGNDEALAALLAHIQRGAVPDGWQVVPMPEPVARMLEWRGRLTRNPPSSARTFEEFPPSEAFPANKGAYWSDGKLLVLADEARTYGDAREAAGYAHAIKVIKRLRDSHQTATGECQSDCDFVAAWDSAIDALRGEVKP